MDFLFTDEQLELRAAVRGFLGRKSAEESVRRLMATDAGYDPAVWQQMSDQLGLQGMAVPEEHAGAGFGYLELGIVFEEMGRALLCAPYLSSVALAAEALLRCADEAARKDLLPGLATGQRIGTLALLEQPGRWTRRRADPGPPERGRVVGAGRRQAARAGRPHRRPHPGRRAHAGRHRPVRGGRSRPGGDAGARADPGPDPQAGAPGFRGHASPADRRRGRRRAEYSAASSIPPPSCWPPSRPEVPCG